MRHNWPVRTFWDTHAAGTSVGSLIRLDAWAAIEAARVSTSSSSAQRRSTVRRYHDPGSRSTSPITMSTQVAMTSSRSASTGD